ncbi:MAG: hypothetical protein ACFFD4_13400 [Candidatus Odinarchaeota archaeon]
MRADAADKIWEAFQQGKASGFRGVPYYQRFGFKVNPFTQEPGLDVFWNKFPQLVELGSTIGQHYSVFQDRSADFQGIHLLVTAPSGGGLTSDLLYLAGLLSRRGISTVYIDLHDLRFEEDNLQLFHPRSVPELRSQFAKMEDSFKSPQILFLDNAACFTDYWSLLVEEFWSDGLDMPLIIAGLSKNEFFFLKQRVLHEDDEESRQFINFFHTGVFNFRPFNHSEMVSLLDHRIRSSGSPPDWLFPPEVVNKIATLSLGIPRLACSIGDTLLQILRIQNPKKDPLTVLSTAAEFSVFHDAVDLLDEVGETLVFENTRYHILRQVLARAGAARMETGICMTRKELLSRNRSLISSYGVQPTHLGNQLPSKISYHLSTLARANLLSVIKEGKRRFYYSTEPYSGVIETLID